MNINFQVEQDLKLDMIHKSVIRQGQYGQEIGKEIEVHIGLLDEIDQKVDQEGSRIQQTTERVEQVEKQSSTKALWITIAVLVLALIGVVVAAVYT